MSKNTIQWIVAILLLIMMLVTVDWLVNQRQIQTTLPGKANNQQGIKK